MRKLSLPQKSLLHLALLVFSVSGLCAQDKGLIAAAAENLGPSVIIGKQYALFIAINTYRTWPALKKPVVHARDLSDTLRQTCYIDEVIQLYNQDATYQNIVKTFTDLQTKLNTHDSLFIYFSGHGYVDKASGQGFWIPIDGGTNHSARENWLSDSRICECISGLKAMHVFMVCDACCSGDLFSATGTIPALVDYRRGYSLSSRQVLSNGRSINAPDHSNFSEAFKMCLRKNIAPMIDPLVIYNDMRSSVHRNAPVYGVINSASHQDGAAFLFFSKKEPEKSHKNVLAGVLCLGLVLSALILMI